MVEMLVMKNPDLFKENRPVEVEFFSRDETGKGRAQARTISQCFDPDWGAPFFSLRGSGSTLMPCRQWSH